MSLDVLPSGRIAASFTHLAWSDEEVVARLEDSLRAPWWLDIARAATAGAASLLIVLLPKCPLCLWAYASALGVTGLQLAPHRAWLLPAAIVLVLTHLLMMGRRAMRARRLLPLCVSAAGTLALIALGYKQVDAHKAVHDLQQRDESTPAEELVKLALKKMASGR